MNSLARDMRSWRAVYRRTQRRAADYLGVAEKTWRRWELGDSRPDVNHHREIRQLLAQAPPDWVVLASEEEA